MLLKVQSGDHFRVAAFFLLVLCLFSIQSCCYPLDYYDYDDNGGLKSSSGRLCPASQAYFNETSTCYGLFTKGPCGELMVFDRILDNTRFGKCNCQQIPQSGCTTRPTVYWPENKRCYYIFDQGPCPKGHWLDGNNQVGPKCEIIPCLQEYNLQNKPSDTIDIDPDSKFLFFYNNKCFTSATAGQDICPPGKEAYFQLDAGFDHICVDAGRKGCPPIVTSEGWIMSICQNGRLPDFNGACELGATLDYHI